MVIGAGFLAKRAVQWTAQKLGLSDETATQLGNITKWGVAIVTLDVGSILVDGFIEGAADVAADTVADAGATSSAQAAAAAAAESGVDVAAAEQSASTAADVAASSSTILYEPEFMEPYEGAYAQECPALSPGDTTAYDSEGEDVEADNDVEDAAEVLEEIFPYIEMAVEAYESSNMAGKFSEMVDRSQVISNVIDTSRLFGGVVGRTDTELHVSILQDETVVMAFRGTEPTEWRTGFADVLTDLAQGQRPVKLYDGSRCREAVYNSPAAIRAHRGFQLALKDVTDSNISSQNLRLVLQNLGVAAEDVSSVVCVGHSLGGALATLCAKWCREVAFPEATIGCVTIGSPRVGNLAFALDFDTRVVDGLNYRVVNKRDVVPCVPNLLTYPSLASAYKHVSRPIYLCQDEVGQISSRLGGRRPTLINLGFFDHPGESYINSTNAVLQGP